MAIKFSNNASTVISSDITATDTSIPVTDASVFPALGAGEHTYVTLENTNGDLEIVKVTAISSNTLTVIRGQDGTTARAYSTGDFIQLRVTAALLNDLSQEAATTEWADILNKPDSVITLSGDVSGSGTMTDLGSVTITTSVSGYNNTNWDTAYSWGDHGAAGYLTSFTETDPVFSASAAAGITGTKITNWDTAYGWGNHASAGYLTSFTETDPVFSASAASGITSTNITNWNTAYGWGDHASAGYLTGNQTITLSGDASGSGTTSIVVTVADDSHNHIISNVDGLQTALDAKQNASTALTTSTTFGGDVSGTYNAIVVANDSHTHDTRYYTESEIDTRMDYTLYSPQSAVGGNLNSLSHHGWYQWSSPAPTNAPAAYGIGFYAADSNQDQQLVQTYGGDTNQVSLYGRRKTSGTWDTVWTQYFSDHYHPNADKWTTARTLSLTGAVTGSASIDGSGNVSLSTTATSDPTLTLSGDASGSATFTNLGNATLSVTVANDSHTHAFNNLTSKTGGTGTYYTNGTMAGATLQGGTNTALTGVGQVGLFGPDPYISFHPGSSVGRYGYLQKINSGGHFLFGEASYVLSVTSFRAPVFYDSDNTGYYVDPASTSRLNNVQATYLTRASHSTGHLVGSYNNIGSNSANTNPIYTIGSSYNPTDSDLSNMYGIGYSHVNANFDGISTVLGDWGLYVAAAGTARIGLNAGSGIGTATNSWRAPIFYSSSNTGYFVEPASISVLSALRLDSTAAYQLYTNNQYLNIRYGSTGAGGIRLYDSGNVLQGFWYGSGGGEHGFLDNDGSWAVRVRTGTSPLILSCNGNDEFYVYTTYTYSPGSSRAPIFYDSNSTAYYFDGSSTGDSIRVAGDIVAYYSDERLKTNLGNIESPVDKVKQLNGFKYHANELGAKHGYDPEKIQVGVSAQEVEAVLPEVVRDAPIGHGFKTVQYERLVPLLIEAIKEQAEQIEALQAEVAKLKG